MTWVPPCSCCAQLAKVQQRHQSLHDQQCHRARCNEMEALQSFCLGCAKYSAGDQTGKLLATVCLAPYFVIYHAAVIVHARREIHMLFVLMGLLLNAGLGMGIKRVLKHPRPAATCEALGICHKHGMPSSHMQVMAFAVTTCLLLYRQRQQGPRVSTAVQNSQRSPGRLISRLIQQLEILLLGWLAAAVGYARVRLGYHTPGQVAVGAAVGCAFALSWHLVWMAAARPHFPRIQRLSAALGMWFRDTLFVEDAHLLEFEVCTAGGKRKPA